MKHLLEQLFRKKKMYSNTVFKISCVDSSQPFIFWINGAVTREIFEELENELLLQLEPQILDASKKNQDLTIEATFVQSETQYGAGEGNVHYLPSYWLLTVIDSEEMVPPQFVPEP